MQTKWVSSGAIFTAVLASACCSGPVVFAGLGLGAFGLSAVFEQYRPFLIAITFGLLGTAFFFTYRKPKEVCADGSCAVSQVKKWNKIFLWVVTVAAIGFVTYPDWSGPLFGKRSKPASGLEVTVGGAQLVTLNVTGMTCAGCATNVKNALLANPGVIKADVSFDDRKATVMLDPESKTTKDDLVKSVANIGYGAN